MPTIRLLGLLSTLLVALLAPAAHSATCSATKVDCIRTCRATAQTPQQMASCVHACSLEEVQCSGSGNIGGGVPRQPAAAPAQAPRMPAQASGIPAQAPRAPAQPRLPQQPLPQPQRPFTAAEMGQGMDRMAQGTCKTQGDACLADCSRQEGLPGNKDFSSGACARKCSVEKARCATAAARTVP